MIKQQGEEMLTSAFLFALESQRKTKLRDKKLTQV